MLVEGRYIVIDVRIPRAEFLLNRVPVYVITGLLDVGGDMSKVSDRDKALEEVVLKAIRLQHMRSWTPEHLKYTPVQRGNREIAQEELASLCREVSLPYNQDLDLEPVSALLSGRTLQDSCEIVGILADNLKIPVTLNFSGKVQNPCWLRRLPGEEDTQALEHWVLEFRRWSELR